eukprot:TRINITY_DN663_c2_g2_i2.p1 TRINITY_DN663_c2_g2~~TRINITY_DN663_c2_g2_i2.p1  ORF type:complete len:208 (-),score=61.71 TRINITY_DN663_c2_g2_i2:10-633(-)
MSLTTCKFLEIPFNKINIVRSQFEKFKLRGQIHSNPSVKYEITKEGDLYYIKEDNARFFIVTLNKTNPQQNVNIVFEGSVNLHDSKIQLLFESQNTNNIPVNSDSKNIETFCIQCDEWQYGDIKMKFIQFRNITCSSFLINECSLESCLLPVDQNDLLIDISANGIIREEKFIDLLTFFCTILPNKDKEKKEEKKERKKKEKKKKKR